jgi:hypothetical protein
MIRGVNLKTFLPYYLYTLLSSSLAGQSSSGTALILQQAKHERDRVVTMTLSPLLYDTYRRYKQDSRIFIQWLGTTARATGLVNDIFEDISEKEHSHNTGHRKDKKQTSAYKIPVNALARLATAVKDSQGSSVPRFIMMVLRDVIKARKGCATWYRAHQADDESGITRSHNEGHQHMIDVLEEVRRILSPLEEKVTIKETEKMNKTVQPIKAYDLLEIEECRDYDAEAKWITPSRSQKTSQKVYESDSSLEDLSFALYCFMKDMTDIRIFVRRTWREYKHHQITLNSAAIIANTAIDIMRRLNNNFVETYPKFEEHRSLIDHLYSGYIDPKAKGLEALDDDSFATYEADGIRLSSKTFFCDHTTAVVTHFFKPGSPPGTLPMYQRHTMDGKGVSEEEHSLLQCLSHFSVLDQELNGPVDENGTVEKFFDDQVLQAIRTMKVEAKFPTWAIFACQIFVDTRRELGSHLGRGFENVQEQGSWLLETWEKFLETRKDNDERVRAQIAGLKRLIKEDFVQELVDGTFNHERYNWGANFLMRNHPLMCGLILQANLVSGHQIGIYIAADEGHVRAAIHLTHAVALAGVIPLGPAWADLNYVVQKHGDEYLFIGERSTTLSDCFRRMLISFGISAANFSTDKNEKTTKKRSKSWHDRPSNQKLPRRMLPMSRYAKASHTLDGPKLISEHANHEPIVMMETLISRFLNSKDVTCPANPHNENLKAKAHFMTPLQSLKMFKHVLKEDDLPLRFDLMSLNWRCVELIHQIQKICVEQSPLDYPAEDFGTDNESIWVIMHMLDGETGTARHQPTRFSEACDLVRDTIAKVGNAEYRQAIARRGIQQRTAVDPKDDPENLEDPDENFIPHGLRQNMQYFSAEMIAHFKSRGKDVANYLQL